VLLRVRLVGICDTDLHLARGYMGFRGVPGHELVGETESGDRFTAEINCSCHACPTCRAGMPNHCPNRTVLGILGHDGAMAEYVSVPRANLHPIPDSLPDEVAVFAEPLAAAYRVPEQIDLASERVAVLGDGKLGLLCAWVARAVGARTTLVGKHPEKLRLAGDEIETVELGSAESLARSFDIVIEATGNPTGLETALRLVRPSGTVVLKTTMTEPHTLALAPLVIDEIRLIGSRCGPFPPALRALESGAVDVRPLIQAEYSLEDGVEAFRVAAGPGARKVLLRP
jgi:threonine dehydrogenase-like Zn-dependent dehydrogenase